MSKYIKLEDAIHNINLEVTGRKEYTGDMKANLFFALDDLPTIDIVHCKDCIHRKVNEHYGEDGYFDLKAVCEIDTGDIFGLGRSAHFDDWFCADGERIDNE